MPKTSRIYVLRRFTAAKNTLRWTAKHIDWIAERTDHDAYPRQAEALALVYHMIEMTRLALEEAERRYSE